MGKYTVTAGQNLYDVALHIYGSIEGITDLMICNPDLSLDDSLRSGQELSYSDDTVIDADVVAWYRNQGVTPSGGERGIYPKTFTLPLKTEIVLPVSLNNAALTISSRESADMELDWGDNSGADHPYFKDPKQLFHTFDNTVTDVRRIKLYGDPVVRSLDLTQMHPEAIYLYRPFPVEEFTLRNARVDLAFISLLENVRTIDLRGTVPESLLPLLDCKTLMELDLRTEALNRESIDRYLTALVGQYYGRRSCTIRLSVEPSGQYREPERDESGRYRISSGMEAVWVLTHEESWNQAGPWRIVVGEKEYTYQPANTAANK